ncbi:hypothetical protein FG05_12405 [Fusarium graminearum]|nr:hypothetical protein FG05_12405 [Fusarium graminearum]
MGRHLVHSFVLTSVLGSLVRAGPCRPSTTSVVAVTTTTATTNSEVGDTTISVPFTTETSGAESTGTTDTTVAIETSIETSTVTDSQTQAISTTAASDAAVTTTTDDAPTTTAEASSTTGAPAPTCVNNFKNPVPEGASCGDEGFPRNSVSYVGNGPVGSMIDCYESCLTQANCQSFAMIENVFCELYSGSLGGTSNVDTSYKWYDIDCFCDTAT